MALKAIELAKRWIKCSNMEKKKEKNKNGLRAKAYLIGPFLFHQSRHHRGCDWV
jgi:hypothetical protein